MVSRTRRAECARLAASCSASLEGGGTRESKRSQSGDNNAWVAASNQTFGVYVRRRRFKSRVRHDVYSVPQRIPIEDADMREIRDRPDRQRLEALELSLVMRVPKSVRIVRLCRRFQFDECSRPLPCALQCDVRPPDTRRTVLRDDGERSWGNAREDPFEEPLKDWSEREFEVGRLHSARLANPSRVLDEEFGRHRRELDPNRFKGSRRVQTCPVFFTRMKARLLSRA